MGQQPLVAGGEPGIFLVYGLCAGWVGVGAPGQDYSHAEAFCLVYMTRGIMQRSGINLHRDADRNTKRLDLCCVQLGMCWGHNTKLNCLEYHRDSEVNVGDGDFILLLAKQDEIVGGVLDTSVVKAFKVPAGVPVEVYATSLHYAPCQANKDEGFRVAVVLPRGTNTDPPGAKPINEEDTWLTARNKWLLAHPDSDEAKNGAHIGLKGVNIDIAADIA